MSNFGFFQLRLVNPYHVAYQEARSAVGASKLLADARQFDTVAEAVADCSLVVGTTAAGRRELKHTLRRLEFGARLIRRDTGPVALLFGSEKYGLGNDDMSHCHWLLRIPTREEHGSMNLGQAVAVCLYELVRDSRASIKTLRRKKPTAAELERTTALLIEALTECGYIKTRTAGSNVEKARRLVRRLELSAQDTLVWQGMLRQMLWKMGSK